VYELICSLGIKAKIITDDAKLYGVFISKRYRIMFSTTLPVFRLKRKAERIVGKIKNKSRTIISCEKINSVPVRCIEVNSESHLFLCTKSFIPTHNSSIMLHLMLIKSINEGVKWALFVPENMPSKLFYTELTEMLVGCDITPSNPHRPEKDLIEQIADFLSEHFIVVHPKELAPTPQYIKSKFLGLIMHKGVSGIFIDPFNRLMNDYSSTSGRDDKYLEAFLADMSNFVKHHDLYSCIIAHPTKLRKVDGEKDYPCPDVFNIAGGAMWNNMMDNILFWHRPYKISEPRNPLCIFKSAKIRWKKIVGHEGELEFMYDFKRRRYYLDNFCPLDTNPFNFVEGGVMFDDVVKDTTGKRIETNPYRMTASDHKQMLEYTFYDIKPLSMKDFAARLKQSLQRYGYPISKSAEFKQYYVQNNYMTEDNGMYFIKTLNNENEIN
jgi:hypothetical protein